MSQLALRSSLSRYAMLLAAAALGLGLGTACNEPAKKAAPHATAPPAPPPEPEPETPATTAANLFRDRCSTCHGKEGLGDGPAGAVLNPKPRVFIDSVWQDSVKDEQLQAIIVKGGAAVGKSAGMPSNPELEKKPEVVTELIKIVRAFKK